MKNTLWRFLSTVMLLSFVTGIARAGTLPSAPNLSFQTSSRERPPTIGDWYTTKTSGSTDRVHRILVEVSQELLNQNGGSITVTVFDADNNGTNDEVFDASDPARFELRAANGTTVLQTQDVPSTAPNGTNLFFTISSPGSYQLVVANGAFPINGDTTAGLNNDDNTYSVNIPGNSTLIGQFQGTFSPTAAVTDVNFYFLVGPGDPNLRLRNFDVDNGPNITYYRPSGALVTGTKSGDGVWNNGGTLNTGEDSVSISQAAPYADAGTWRINLSAINSGNQFALEANAGNSRLVLLDQPPTADAGNFAITPDGTLPGTIGSPTNHPFSVTNYFFTNDIINFTLTGTAANYTAQLIDASTNTALTDSDNDGKLDTGILAPGVTKNFILRVTPQAGAGASSTTRVSGVSFMDTKVVPGTVTTEYVDKTTQLTTATNVSGTVYDDANYNGTLDSNETGLPTTNFFVKLVPAAGGNAVAFAPVNSSNGTYSLLNVTPGNYTLVLDDNNSLTDTTPAVPAGTSGTEAANGTRTVVVPAAGAINQNFGRYTGVAISGRVFKDDGTPTGTANDGTLNGTEIGISGVIVRAQNSAGTITYDDTTTDANGNYTVYAPVGSAIRIVETNPSSYRSTGGTVGNSGGTYSIANDAITFNPVAGTTYANLNFGDVPPSIFTNDNIRTAGAGETVIMPHVFTAGTAGTLNFSFSAVSNPASGWSNVLYRDTNGDGILQSNEPVISGPITVTAGQQIAILAKVFTPLGAAQNSTNSLNITAALTYANAPSIIESISRTDLVTVAAGSGLVLVKTVDRATARTGDDIIYVITYRNSGNDTIRNIVINDTTPAYTTFRSGSNGPLPTGLTAVTPTFPTVGTAGPVRWTFTGALPPGGSGTVTFTVRL